jgi:hypothetical protein
MLGPTAVPRVAAKVAAPITGILTVTDTVVSIGLDATSALAQNAIYHLHSPQCKPVAMPEQYGGNSQIRGTPDNDGGVGPHTLIPNGVPLNQVNENAHDGMYPIYA